MNNFFNQKVTGHVGPAKHKSHGTIIDNLADYSDDMDKTYQKDMGASDSWRERYIRVPQLFLDKFPDMLYDKAQKHYNTYLDSLRQLLLKRMPFVKSNYTHLSLDKLWATEFQYKNNRYYIYKEFSSIRPFFYAPDHKKGNGRKKGNRFEQNSEVYMFNQNLIDLLIDTADVEQLVALYYGELTDNTIDSLEVVPIDMHSLDAFIENTNREIQLSTKNSKHEATLYRNLRQAKYIKLISEYFYSAFDRHVLPQIPNPSEYGRVYYKGINIQNSTKEVRTACLGNHCVYDLNAAVYAIKLMMVRKILKDNNIDDYGHFTYTKEYLDWKSPIRKKLAEHIKKYPDPEKLVKEAITAIGFGARIGGGSWQVDGEWHTTSIEDIIMNPTDRHNFMNDPWIKEFVREQQAITTIITDEFKKDKSFCESVANVPNMFKNNKIRKSQIMSYVFQHAEKAIMDQITSKIPVVARVHDSFITLNKLSNEQITDIKYQLSNLEPLMTLDCQEFHAWISKDNQDDESDIDEQFSRLTGVQHTRPKIKLQRTKSTNNTEGFYDSQTDYGQSEYDPELDDYTEAMTHEQRREHYRIIGYNPNTLPDFSRDKDMDLGRMFEYK
jgi:hypothetical protein